MPELAIDERGDLAIPTRLVFGVEAVAVRAHCRLRLVRGTWITDEGKGLPWQGDGAWALPSGKGPGLERVRSNVRAQLLDVDGIEAVEQLTVTREGRYGVRVVARCLAAEAGEDGVFVVEVANPYATAPAVPYTLVAGYVTGAIVQRGNTIGVP